MKDEEICVRGHHLLCAPRYVGLGYTAEFARNMSAVLSRLRAGHAKARLVDGPDAICQACPNLKDGSCRDGGVGAEGIRSLQDRYVLGSLGIEVGSLMHWSQIEQAGRAPAIEVDFVCGGCRWSETCWESKNLEE